MVVMLALLLAGCATAPRYQATVVNRSDGAIVRGSHVGGWFGDFTDVWVEKVDGLPCSVRFNSVLVDPGSRVFSVAGIYAGWFGGRDTGRVELNAIVKAGHTYRIKVERSRELMTFWVEDEAMHEAASQKQSTNTIHWIRWL